MNQQKPAHCPNANFPVHNGEITLSGIGLNQIALRVGSTPFYAYDRNLISARVAEIRQALPKEVSLHYALKANPMPAVVQHLSTLVDGIDVASAGEIMVALDTGIMANKISFAGPGKTNAELSRAIAAKVTINIESFGEMYRIADISKQQGINPAVAIRVNPDFELKSSGMKMSGGSKPFGIDAEQVPEMLSQLTNLNLDFQGFHIFSGSQNLLPEAILETQRLTLELALELANHAPQPPNTLNIGGGFGIPYFPGETSLDLKLLGRNLAKILPLFHKHYPETQIILELGRYLVGEAGVYVSRIVDRKVSRGQIYLITDGGMHHHLAASGNFGQVIRKNYPVAISHNPNGRFETDYNREPGKKSTTKCETVNIVGCLCTPLDRLGDKMELPAAQIGDYVVLFQSGAYGLSASPVAFLGHPLPMEVLI